MSANPPLIPLPPQKPERKLARWALLGAAVGVALPALLAVIGPSRNLESDELLGLVAAANLLLPPAAGLVAIVLAIIPKTRPFGLGLLLATGVCALIQLALCGGVAVLG